MNRREIFKSVALLGATAALPSKLFANKTAVQPGNKIGFRRFKLGELELTVISDGMLNLSPVQPFFAPDIEPEKVKDLLTDSFRPTDGIQLGINILIVKKAGNVIMIDSGTGANGSDAGETSSGSGKLINALASSGYKPADITDIVISHGHPDHIGGLLNKEGKPAFANAKIHIAKLETDFWLSPNPDFSKCRVDPKMIQTFADATRKILKGLEKQLHYYAPGDTLLGCIKLQLAAGHTPGHTLTHVYSGNEELVHIADLVHSDVLLFPHPDWGFFGDNDFKMAASTRRRVFEELSQSRKRVIAYHLPWPGLGYVKKQGEGFQWIPEVFPTPDEI